MASSDLKVPYQWTDFVPFAESLNGRLARAPLPGFPDSGSNHHSITTSERATSLHGTH
jgi:hypothetical protein